MILLFMLVVKGSLIPLAFILFFKFHIEIKASHGIFENYTWIEGYDYIGEYAN